MQESDIRMIQKPSKQLSVATNYMRLFVGVILRSPPAADQNDMKALINNLYAEL